MATNQATAVDAKQSGAPEQGTHLISLRDAGKRYGNILALQGVDMDVDPGRVTCVLGDNGAGKSSLYWALYTFLQSARKPRNSIAKYFDPAGAENLLNIHEQVCGTCPDCKMHLSQGVFEWHGYAVSVIRCCLVCGNSVH